MSADAIVRKLTATTTLETTSTVLLTVLSTSSCRHWAYEARAHVKGSVPLFGYVDLGLHQTRQRIWLGNNGQSGWSEHSESSF